MAREVNSKDGRRWTVESRINWSQSESEDQFEHDMAAGHVSGIIILALILTLVLFVVFWTPPGVVIPSWLVLLFLLLPMLMLMGWVTGRKWTIVAKTVGEDECWQGTTHGMMTTRHDTRQVVKNLEERSNPDDGSGLLRQVT